MNPRLGNFVLVICLLGVCGSAEAEWSFVRGDANGDGSIGLPDVIYSLNYLFLQGPSVCLDAIDLNDDGSTGLPDALYLLIYLFQSGPEPAPPFPDCGVETTPDNLTCEGPLAGCDIVLESPAFYSAPVTVANVASLYRYDANAVDPAMEALTYELVVAPTDATINLMTGLVEWTPTVDDAGAHPFLVRVTSESENFAQQGYDVVVQPWPAPPTLNPVATPTTASSVTLSGTATAASQVEISDGEQSVTAPVTGTSFMATLDLAPNTVNVFFVRALNSAGQASAPTVVCVTQDQTPPDLFVDFPTDDAEVLDDAIVVAGRVTDLLSGFMGLAVTVNGLAAEVEPGIGTNGTFESSTPVPLSVGENTITAAATDAAGNIRTVQITVTRLLPDSDQPQMMIIAGNGQSATALTDVPSAIMVQVLDTDGTPFANKLVTFRVTRSDGRLRDVGADPAEGVMLFQTFTDASGLASAQWRLGTDAGCGNNRVEVTSNGIQGSLFFHASAVEGSPVQINIGTGSDQVGEVGTEAAMSLRAWVNDGCNGVATVPVTFTVVQGNGRVNGQRQVMVVSTLTGHAQVDFIFGSEPGVNLVEATMASNQGEPALFVLEALIRDEAQPTSFRGNVLNNAGEPVETALCTLHIGDELLSTVTSSDGVFVFEDIPEAGHADLFVWGGTADSQGGEPVDTGSFPYLQFEPVIVPNTENSLPFPIRLPPLQDGNTMPYSTTEETVLTLEGVDGFRLVVEPGSAYFPTGDPATDGVTLSLDIVHFDDLPMTMPDGAYPPFAWTVQPAGMIFDPPARVEIPNASGLPGGAIAYFLAFSHDTNRFEILGSGSVTPDGSTVVSDPGSGVQLAGWSGFCPPYSSRGDCRRRRRRPDPCSYVCENSGTLIDSGVFTQPPSPDYGETISFLLQTVSDTGGCQTKICPDGTVEELTIDPGSLSHYWTITTPTGGTITGTGESATVMATECGDYQCIFTVESARDCPPNSLQVESSIVSVESAPEEPIELPPLAVDLSPLSEAMTVVLGILSSLDGLLPCSPSLPTDTQFMVPRQQFQQCCETNPGEFQLVNLQKWFQPSGSTNMTLGALDCEITLFGLPFIGELNAIFALAIPASANFAKLEQCNANQVCVDINMLVIGQGGLALEVFQGYLVIAPQIVVQGSGTAQWCYTLPSGPGAFVNPQVGLNTVNFVTEIQFDSGTYEAVNLELWTGPSQPLPI